MTGDLVVTNAQIFDGSTADLTEGAVQIRDEVIVSVGMADPGSDTLHVPMAQVGRVGTIKKLATTEAQAHLVARSRGACGG